MSALMRPVGMLKDYAGGQSELPVEAGISILVAMRNIGIPPELVALALVNDTGQPKDYIIQDGDRIQLFAVIGGG